MFRPHTLYIRIRIVRKVHEPVFAMRDQDVSDVIKTKNRTAMQYIGIDVSKATFVVAYSSDKGGEIRTFNNTTAGIKQFIGTLPKDGSIHCVMEATGNYSALLLYMLNVAGITVSMENPLKVKNFARAMLSTVKTDKIDARLIALYGEKMNPQPFKVQGEAILRLRQKRTVIRQLTKQITAMSNLRGSLACLPVPDKGATHTVDETIKFLEKRRDRLQSELTDLVEVEFSRQLALFRSDRIYPAGRQQSFFPVCPAVCGRLFHSWSKLTHSASFPLPAQMDCEKENHLKTRKSTSWHSHKRKGHCIISLNIV